MLTQLVRCFLGLWLGMALMTAVARAADQPLYEHGDIAIPKATIEEPKLAQLSVPLALEYLEKGTAAWNGQRKCITCHTNGTYMLVRPALTAKLGTPNEATREFFLATLKTFVVEDRARSSSNRLGPRR